MFLYRTFIYWCLFFGAGLLVSCQNPNQDPNILQVVKSEIPGQLGNDRICIQDSTEFWERMGIGVMVLNIRPGDSIHFVDQRIMPGPTLVLQEERGSWVLTAHNKYRSIPLVPFRHATNFENFSFIWRGSVYGNIWEGVILNDEGNLHLIKKETGPRPPAYFIPWETYLSGSVIIRSNLPTHQSPMVESEIIDSVSGAFKVLDVKQNWMEIAPLDPEDPSQSQFNSVGWIQWYCGNELRIVIADDTLMEDFYQDARE